MGDVLNRGTRDKPRWYCRYLDENGRRRQKATHQPTKAGAEQYLAQVEARIARGEVGIVERTPEERARRSLTVAELAARFLGDVDGVAGYGTPRIKDLTEYRSTVRSSLRRVLEILGARPAAAIRPADIEALRDRLLVDGYAAGSVRVCLAYVGKLFAWGRKVGLVRDNPAAGVERPRAARSLDFLAHAEVGRLLALAEKEALAAGAAHEDRTRWPLVAVAVYAGLRRGEISGLRWSDIALTAARLDVSRSYRGTTKTGKARHLPIHPELGRALRWWRDHCPKTPEGLVFPRADGEMYLQRDPLGLPELLGRAECHLPADGRYLHMLRHTHASHAVMSGVPLEAVTKLLGHASITMSERYAHLSPDWLAGSISRLSFAPPATADVIDLRETRGKRTGTPDH